MPNYNRIITLATKGTNSGPLYDIYYSTDCINYTICIDGSGVSLPTIGSTAIITLPDNSSCIKLVNLSVGCFLNEVTQSIQPITTTTTSTTSTTTSTTSTTTLAPTTTTSTTTAAPTTTTSTTLAPTTTTTTTQCPCVETVTLDVTEAGSVDFTDCYGIGRSTSVGTGIQTLDYASDGCIQWATLSGTAMFTIDAYGPCCTPPNTTTTTSTTTTTAAPTTTTTTADPYDYYEADEYSCDGCTFQQSNVRVAFLTGTSVITANRYYRPATPTGFIYKNFVSVSPGISIIMTSAGNSANCDTVCGNTTTTTTSTTTTIAPTTTTTTAAPTKYLVEPCGGGAGPFIITLGSGDTPSGIGQAYKISGNSGAGFNGVTCWEVLEIDPVGTPDYTNLAFGTVFSNCLACNPTTTTTSTSTTTTTLAPTTTTTTADPYDYYEANEYICTDCSFQQSNVRVAFPAGTSVVTANRYYRPATPTGFIYKDFTSVSPGISIIMTSAGNSTNCNTVCGNTTTTTSTTTLAPTTTTTTAAPTTTTTTAAPTTTTTTAGAVGFINVDTNASLDISLYLSSITVNGVTVINVSGVDPNTPGNGGSCETTQIGTYDVIVPYSCGVAGQHIDLTDSNGTLQCYNTSTGFGNATFTGVVINTSVGLTLVAADGTC